jgi:hypothetical protein
MMSGIAVSEELEVTCPTIWSRKRQQNLIFLKGSSVTREQLRDHKEIRNFRNLIKRILLVSYMIGGIVEADEVTKVKQPTYLEQEIKSSQLSVN